MSSHEGLIGLDGTFEQLPSAVSPHGAELVEHRPSGLVAAKAEIALKLQPGDSFAITMKYDSRLLYEEAEADLGIYSGQEAGLYFQTTNKAQQEELTLKTGSHKL